MNNKVKIDFKAIDKVTTSFKKFEERLLKIIARKFGIPVELLKQCSKSTIKN